MQFHYQYKYFFYRSMEMPGTQAMTTTTKPPLQFDDLPLDLQHRIFSFLPISSFARSRCVSKRWLCVLRAAPRRCPAFMTAEGDMYVLSGGTAEGNHGDWLRRRSVAYSRAVIASHGTSVLLRRRDHVRREGKKRGPVPKLQLYNPFSERRAALPRSGPMEQKCCCNLKTMTAGMGRLRDDGAVKMVRITRPSPGPHEREAICRHGGGHSYVNGFSFEMATVGVDKRWRRIDLNPHLPSWFWQEADLSFDGSLYWSTLSSDGGFMDGREPLVVLDLATEAFKLEDGPEIGTEEVVLRKYPVALGNELGYAVHLSTQVDVWVRRENGMDGLREWCKWCSIANNEVPEEWQPRFSIVGLWINRESLFVFVGKGLVAYYSLTSRLFTKIEVADEGDSVVEAFELCV